jgi:hypothetical protein
VWIPLVRIGQLVGLVALGAVTSTSIPNSASVQPQPQSPPPAGTIGYDVGAQSCSAPLPSGGSFGVVGATAGRPFHPSACLGTEIGWAQTRPYRPQYYLNLANPGRRSSHWGHGGPRTCHRTVKNDAGCAYNYGVASAAAAVSYVRAAGGNPRARWWLDVEIDNTWGTGRAGVAANIADIRGARHYLRAHLNTTVGVYTETGWWSQITRGVRMRHVPVWGGGANSKRHARQNCRTHSITGGPALMVQWIVGTTDHDLTC